MYMVFQQIDSHHSQQVQETMTSARHATHEYIKMTRSMTLSVALGTARHFSFRGCSEQPKFQPEPNRTAGHGDRSVTGLRRCPSRPSLRHLDTNHSSDLTVRSANSSRRRSHQRSHPLRFDVEDDPVRFDVLERTWPFG